VILPRPRPRRPEPDSSTVAFARRTCASAVCGTGRRYPQLSMTKLLDRGGGGGVPNRHSCWSHRVHQNVQLVYISSPVVAVRTGSSRGRAPLQSKEPGSTDQAAQFSSGLPTIGIVRRKAALLATEIPAPGCLSTSRPNLRWCSSSSLSAEREADSGYPPAISHILWSYDISTRTT
jgi:hypothetical protein